MLEETKQQELQSQENTGTIQKSEILNLIQKIVEQNTADRETALKIFERLTKDSEFDSPLDIMYKGETAARFFDSATKSTSELTKLLSILHKFYDSKAQSENVDKLISAGKMSQIVDLMDKMNLSPIKKDVPSPVKEEKVELEEKEEFDDLEDVDG